MFWVLYGYIAYKPLINTELVFSDIQQHLLLIYEYFAKYFIKETYENFNWILNLLLMQKPIF